ncbi:sugar phosphate isomerase/epimerase family protein [Dactylosporangium cerinum]|uniref:Sugar phosphate isomerase/epimerase family protein n=1 Tax=Dactylosporangium cerinum TaxID=1434730 RepID=A0ABV9WHP0_9ACTN
MTGVAVSTGSLYDLDVPTEDAVDRLAEMGVRAVEVFLQCDPELDERFLAELRARCDARGVRVVSVHPYGFGYENLLYSPYRRQRRWAFARYERYLEACGTLGATHYVAHGPPRHLAHDGAALRRGYIEGTALLAELAGRHGVRYCLENVSYGLLRTPDEAVAHLAQLGPAVPFVLDFKSAWKCGVAPQAFAAAVGRHIAYTHVSYRGSATGPFGLTSVAGRPEPDITETMRRLAEAGGMTGPHVVEVFGPASLDDVAATFHDVTRHLSASLQPPYEP